MKKILIFTSLILAINQVPAQAASTTNTTQKATATLTSVCTISSQNVNFGQISLPISAQSATSSMAVQCTKGSSYTIALAYGGVYGTSTGNGSYWEAVGCATNHVAGITPPSCGNNDTWWYEYNAAGTVIASEQLNWSTNTAPTGVTGYNGATQKIGGVFPLGTNYNYGEMIGVAKGDQLGYFIEVPNNPSEVWNVGNYNYTTTGTGATQSIPLVATLVPGQTTNKYPTADVYMDVVTATITY